VRKEDCGGRREGKVGEVGVSACGGGERGGKNGVGEGGDEKKEGREEREGMGKKK